MKTLTPIRESSSDRKWKWLARGWLAVGLAVSAILFIRAMPHSQLRGSSPQAMPTAVAGATVNSAQGTTASVDGPTTGTETVYVRRLITQPIETIRVGQRVLGTNPDRDEVEEFEEPDPKTWRTIEVEQVKPSGKRLYATLLRPLEWIEEELDPETNTIELDLPELGAEGTAKVLRIGPCPPIASGNGHIVTATFKHEPNGELLTVTVGNDEIGCTANHPFWSEDRQEFVEAGQLRQGERVRTRLEEVAAVVAIKPRPPTEWVYNFEVQGEHVYEVGPNGILVHNVYNKCTGQSVYILYDEVTKQIKYIGRGDHIVRLARHAKDPVKGKLKSEVLHAHTLTKGQAKGLEHRLIEHFGGTTKNNPGIQLLNNYVGIGATNPNKANYLRVSKQLFEDALKTIKSLGLH
jgi:hypothetical protein